jgi:hypothetical protein
LLLISIYLLLINNKLYKIALITVESILYNMEVYAIADILYIYINIIFELIIRRRFRIINVTHGRHVQYYIFCIIYNNERAREPILNKNNVLAFNYGRRGGD